ncbi:phosphatase PAP2 family protein [Pedobacter sp. Du54]|uniref:phosphatase PAP2 family protein n=1 Tax=Pedobacter anseongensis TaxID=3133439 RepID=UPI0030A1DAEB
MRYLVFVFVLLTLNAKAQVPDSALHRDEKHAKFSSPKNPSSYIIPTVLISYGFLSLGSNGIRNLDLSTQAELSEDHPQFASTIDDYSKFIPIMAMYALDLTKLKAKHTVFDQTALMVISAIITDVTVTSLKRTTLRLRPSGSGYSSFPSGHTAVAFAAAELLHQEFKEHSPWIGYAGYGIAGATGVSRMYNNKHWLSDVIAGAGFGLLSTKISYVVYPYIKRILSKKEGLLRLAPTLIENKPAFSLNYTFNK